jgi:type II/III secretion system protein
MKKTLFLMIATTAGLYAQEANAPVPRIIDLKHATAGRVKEMLGVFGGPGVEIRADPEFNRIIVLARPEIATAIEQFTRKLDVAPTPPPPQPQPKNIEVTVYMLAAQQQPEPGSIPDDLSGVVKQLRGVFGLQGFRVLETMVMRGREGKGGEASGLMNNPVKGEDGQPSLYQFKYSRASISGDDKARTIRLDGVRFGGRIPVAVGATGSFPGQAKSWQYLETGVNTDVDVREGQKVVIGKASVGAPNSTLFLVVSAKVVD